MSMVRFSDRATRLQQVVL
ncbi:hypothetical protein LINPERHAP1_LOCUS1558 [Linum perenne]